MRVAHTLVAALLAIALVVAPLVAPPFWITLLNYIGLYSIVALGLVLLTGVAGQTSFGQAAFVGFGAYTTAYLSINYPPLSPWLNLAVGVALTMAASLGLGFITLRMKGHYLPLATIAWGTSLYYLFGNLEFLGGHTGIAGIAALSLFGLELRNERYFYYVIWAIALFGLWATRNLLDSRPGRAVRALKGGLEMVESFGVDAGRLKIVVFVYAAVLACVAGWLYAHLQRFINPTPFGIPQGIEYLFMAVVGGAGSVWGAVVGATLITLLKQVLQDLLPKLLGRDGNFEIVVFGILMIFLLQRTREGVWPWLARLLPQRPTPVVAPAQPLPRHGRTPHAGALLTVDRARKEFGGLVAVSDLSFDIRNGEILALIGPNGAGKSTMFNLISGALPLTRGTISFNGIPIGGLQPYEIARLGIARTFQHVKLITAMSVLDNVALGAYLRGNAGVGRAAARLDRAEDCARQATPRRDCARACRGPLAAIARRARRGLALSRKAGTCHAAAEPPRQWDDGASGRARHGLRHGTLRPARGHGFRRKARRGAPRGYPVKSPGARGVPGWRVTQARADDTMHAYAFSKAAATTGRARRLAVTNEPSVPVRKAHVRTA